jgi:hypothetical protein
MNHSIDTASEYEAISSIFTSEEISKIFEFYLHRGAISTDSPLSLRLDTSLDDTNRELLYNDLLKTAGIDSSNFIFGPDLTKGKRKLAIITQKLDDINFICDGVKGFFNGDKLTQNVCCLFKRIRNSLAHGRIAVNGKFLILEDKGTSHLTARLVITKEILLKWITIVEDFVTTIEKGEL